jgi:enoyl-CoA hydratase
MQYISLKKENNFFIIKLNRPDRLNALGVDVVLELSEALDKVAKNDEIRVVIITGEGKAFSAGEDVKDIPEQMSTRYSARKCLMVRQRFLKSVADLDQIVIAAVNGHCIGLGLALAIYSDLIIVSESASFAIPELSLGSTLSYGVLPRLVYLVGWLKAKELILTRESINAQEAYRIGLINKVVHDDQLMAEARKMGHKVLEAAPGAAAITKSYINAMLSINLADASAFDPYLCAGFVREDLVEGFRAFTDKRKPRFERF